MLGHWKNFDELESNLSLDELTALLDITRKKDYEDKKFLAAVNGIDLDEESQDQDLGDIADLTGYEANREGFGVGQGIEVMEMEG